MLNYWNRQDNPATFETLEEVRTNAPAVTSKLSGAWRFKQILNPALENFPNDIAYFYRSPNIYGGETGARNNTTFIVFAPYRLETKEEGKAYLKERRHRSDGTQGSKSEENREPLFSFIWRMIVPIASSISFTRPNSSRYALPSSLVSSLCGAKTMNVVLFLAPVSPPYMFGER